MKRHCAIAALLVQGLLVGAPALAEPPASVQNEVNFLLGSIERSGCEFYRNGTWHNSSAAQLHLRQKYEYLVGRNLINSTESFIESAATESSFTGQAYEVRCVGSVAVRSNQWLREALARYRAG